jgi:hypothetical protein
MIEKKKYSQNPKACSVCGLEKLFRVKSKKICFTCNEKAAKEKAKIKRKEKREKKALSHKVLITKLDQVFSQYVRISRIGKDGLVPCFTCEGKYPWKQIQCGHFQSRRYLSVRFNEDNCRPQCYACNVGKSGEQFRFGINLDLELGQGFAELMEQRAKQIKKFETQELLDMIDHYKARVERLKVKHQIWE